MDHWLEGVHYQSLPLVREAPSVRAIPTFTFHLW
jgi:hypothetical protein